VPVKTLPELVAYAKANPGKLTYAAATRPGSWRARRSRAKPASTSLHVPYKSTPRDQRCARRARLDDRHDMAPGWNMCAPEISARLRSRRRNAAAAARPASLAEAGIPGYDVTSYAALFAPAGTRRKIVTS